MTPPAEFVWKYATLLAAPPLRVALARRLARGKELPGRLGERRGFAGGERPTGELVWIHAASVGESLAVLPVADDLLVAGDRSVLLTTGTASAARLLGPIVEAPPRAGRMLHRMAPLDVPCWVGRFLDHWRPAAAVFVESELWPNTLAHCRRSGVHTVLVNGRMSAASARAWRRFAPGLARHMLSSFSLIVARSPADAARLEALGARVDEIGDLKWAGAALDFAAGERDRIASLLTGRPVLVAASTHPGEEEVLLDAASRLAARLPNLLTIVAPRHPERGEVVSTLLGNAPRRSLGCDPRPDAAFWVVDTLGELGLVYRLAPIAFLGRSLAREASGGQNPLEPARLGVAIAVGPECANFAEAGEALIQAGALTVVADAAELADWALRMLSDPTHAAEAGARGCAVATRRQGLAGELARRIAGLAAAAGERQRA